MPLPQGTFDPALVATSEAAAGTSPIVGAIVLQASPSGALMTIFTPGGPQPTVNVGGNGQLAAQQAACSLGMQLGPWYRQANQIAAPLYPVGNSPYGAGGSYAQNCPAPAGGSYGNSAWGGSGNPYRQTPIIPDSQLPRALKRLQPLGAQYPTTPNQHDRAIQTEAALWTWIAAHGGLKGCCRIPELGSPVWNSPDWKTMQSQDEQFTKPYSLPTDQVSGGGPYTGVDTLLGSFQVPRGYDGAINRFVCQFSGNGHIEFSGDIVWRVKINARYARNLGNVTYQLGSLQQAMLVPGTDIIRLISGQTVALYANIPEDSAVSGGNVTAAVFGWFTPRR